MMLFRRYLDLLMRTPGDRRRIAVLVILMTIGAAMEAVGVGLIMPFIALLQNPALVHESRPLERLSAVFGLQTATGATMLVGVLLVLVFVVKNLYLALTTYFQMRFLYERMTFLSRDLLAGYLGRRY